MAARNDQLAQRTEGDDAFKKGYRTAVQRLMVSLLEAAGFWRSTYPLKLGSYDALPEGDWRDKGMGRVYARRNVQLSKANVKAVAKHLRSLDATLTQTDAERQAKLDLELPSAAGNREAAAERNALSRWASRVIEALQGHVANLLPLLRDWTPADLTALSPVRARSTAASVAGLCAPLQAEAAKARTRSTGLQDALLRRLATVGFASALGADFEQLRSCASAVDAAVDALAAAVAAASTAAPPSGPVDAMVRFVADLRTAEAALKKAYDDANERVVQKHFELRDNQLRQNRSCAAAGVALRLENGVRGTDVRAWLRDTKALAAITALDPASIHTSESAIGGVLAKALAQTPLPNGVTALPGGDGNPGVEACRNIQSSKTAPKVTVALKTVVRLLEYARDRNACPHGKSAMAKLEYHGPPGESKTPKSKQHDRQCSHAELVLVGLLLAELAVQEDSQLKTYSPAPRDPALCLLLLVSRNCCNSCRYALPHLARLLKVDIVVQFRTRAGELSDPIVFPRDAEPLPKQMPYAPQGGP